jgi:membrane-bound lytic murein transglycosylase A
VSAIEKNLEYLNRIPPERTFQYGRDRFTAEQVRRSQEHFLKLIADIPSAEELNRRLKSHFQVYRVSSEVLFTGYFEPLYDGSLSPDHTYRYPLYGKPSDLIEIDLSLFNTKYKGQSIVARIQDEEVLPYYSRREIDTEGVLQGRDLEIAWLKDPLDVAFLQIQGSGRIRLPDGRTISVGYLASNGRLYRSIGRLMLSREWLQPEEMSMQRIRTYLAEHPQIVREVLDHNPAYVFFRRTENGPFGNLGIALTAGRSLALDKRLFPGAALGFMKCRKPILDSSGQIKGWAPFARFVVNQDTGGAIKGACRADLFWGRGSYAEVAAGHLRHEGELYMLIKKP